MKTDSIKVSVILLTYNPVLKKLIRTIKSIILQEGINFELIICDDGSEDSLRNNIESFLKSNKFYQYSWIEHNTNVGTVNNLLDGVKIAKGEFIKDIGQGDLLADRDVLKRLYTDCKQNNYQGLFSDAVHFINKNDFIEIVKERAFPQNINQFNSHKKLIKNYIKCNDFINGSTTFFEKRTLLFYLEEASGKVKLLEDKLIKLMILDNVKLGFLKKSTVLYETDSGVSNTSSKLKKQFYADNLEAINLMQRRLRSSFGNRHMLNLLEIDAFRANGDVLSYLNWVLRDYDVLIFELRKRIFTRKTSTVFNRTFISNCVECEVINASN